MRRIVVSFSLAVILLLVAAMVFGQGMNTPGEDGDDVLKKPLPEGASKGWFAAVQKDLAMKEYNLSPPADASKGFCQAPNRAQGFRSFFSEKGVKLCPREDKSEAWQWGLEVIVPSGLERRTKKESFKKPEITIRDNRIELDRGWLKEWFVNSHEGLEQGFTIEKRFNKSEKLNIDMKLTGNLHPRFAEDGQRIDFYDKHNVSVISYSKLKAKDSNGQVLPSKFVGVPGAIRIEIDDSKAVYPVTVDPLATSPSWSVQGDQDSSHFGRSVATAGDVNGDGFSDVIIGAFRYDSGETDEGKVFIYYGSSSGLSSSPAWAVEGNQAGAMLGLSVATAGDVNGDGFADVIVGAPYFSSGNNQEGIALLYLGSFSGPGAFPAWTGEGNQDEAIYGWSVATAGDVNGDGYSDVVVGAYKFDNGQTDEGSAYLYLGSSSGLSAVSSWTAECDQEGAAFGVSVATAGDVNGDGFSDVIVGADQYENGQAREGGAFLYLGSASGLSSTPAWMEESDKIAGYFGVSVATAGDVNGDGYADVIVGAESYSNGESFEGRAFLYLGSASGLSANPVWTAEGDQETAHFGCSVASAGDVNGDGYADVIVGAHQYDNVMNNRGRAYLYFGSASGLAQTPDWITEGEQQYIDYGISVATAGDVNGDGYSDIIVGAEYWNTGDGNSAYVYHGGPSGPSGTAAWNGLGENPSDYFSCSVSSAGDVNGDGYSDVIIGAYGYSDGYTGKAYLYLGGASGLSSSALWESEGEDSSSYYGESVAGVGDVNGDGYSDIMVGASRTNGGYGKAYLYLGGASGPGSSASWTRNGEASGDTFGCSVAPAGDVNGDGFADVVIGASGHAGITGKAYLFMGGSTGLAGAPSWTVIGEASNDNFGCPVATAGDVNGDGYSDVLVGAWGNSYYTGKAYLYMGGPYGLSSSPSWVATGEGVSNYLGYSLATAGDVNGDGYSDVAVGAFGYNNFSDVGKIYLYLGSASGLSPTPSWTVTGESADDMLGRAVSAAGDVNGDGFSDLLAGAIGYSNLTGRAYVFLGSESGLGGTSAWMGTGESSNNYFGVSVGNAGDVNGDGFADLIAGATGFNSSAGKAYLFYGNGCDGLDMKPMQRTVGDTRNICLLGMSNSETAFNTKGIGRTPYGRGKVKGQWEVKPLGTSFNATGMSETTWWTDTGLSGAELAMTNGALQSDKSHHWRMRFIYDKATTPFQQKGRWFTIPVNGWQEADLKTDCGALAMPMVTVTDKDQCAMSGISVSWPAIPGAVSYDIKVDGATTTGVTSPYSYEPGDTNTHTYAVMVRNVCGETQWSDNRTGADANEKPGPVYIDSITDNDPCSYGITIDYSGGGPSESYDLLRDGIVVGTGISDPVSYNPMDTVQHFYEVRANYLTCSTKSAPQNFTDASGTPSMPTMDSFGEVDGCVQNGIKIYFTGGTPSTRHDLYRDFSLVQSNVTSPVTYDPGDAFTHNYQIRTYNGTCWNEPMPSQYADEVSAAPPQPSITSITDADPCDMSGISVSYTVGMPSDRYALYMDGSEVVPAMTGSPYLFLTPDTLAHNYVVRAYNHNCFTASTGVNGTDADNKTVPVIIGPHENTCPVKTVTLTTQSGMSNYQWYHGGYPMTGANSDTIVVNEGEDGSYTVSFTNGSGCNATSSEHLVTIMPCPCEDPVQEVSETVNTDKSGFSWTAISAEHYRVVRGVLADLPNLKTSDPDFSCYKWGADASLGVNIAADLPENETGRCYYYLIQGYNCEDPDQFLGPAGEYSAGNQRSVETPSNCD